MSQMSFNMGPQFEPIKTHTSGPYTASYRKGDTHADVTHKSDPKEVIDRIPVDKTPAKNLINWHKKMREEYR